MGKKAVKKTLNIEEPPKEPEEPLTIEDDTEKILETIDKTPKSKPKRELTEEQKKNRMEALQKAVQRKKELSLIKKAEQEEKNFEKEKIIFQAKNKLEKIEKQREEMIQTKIDTDKEEMKKQLLLLQEKIQKLETKPKPDIIEKTSKELLLKQLQEEQAMKLRRELFSYA